MNLKMIGAAAGALILAAAIGPARAGVLTGNDWAAFCRGNQTDKAFCTGYAFGIADALSQGGADAIICAPAGAQAKELLDLGLRYISKRPERRQDGANELLTQAFIEAWPCDKGGGK
jgi:hypothetical protein